MNHKRKTAIEPGTAIRVDDLIALYSKEGSDTVHCEWLNELDWQGQSSNLKLLGIIKALTDSQSGICVGMQYVAVDDIDIIDPSNATWKERTRDAISSMMRPFAETPRNLYLSEKEGVSLQTISTLAEKGVNVVANVSTSFDGLQIRDDWITSCAGSNSNLLAKSPLRVLPSSSSESGFNDQLYFFVPLTMSRDVFVFNAGNTNNIALPANSKHFLDPSVDYTRGQSEVPEIVVDYQKAMLSRQYHNLIVSCRDDKLSANQALVVQIYNAVVIQSAIDAYNVFSMQGQSSSSSSSSSSRCSQLKFGRFINRLAKALLDKSAAQGGTTSSTSVANASAPVEESAESAGESNNQTIAEAAAMLLNAQVATFYYVMTIVSKLKLIYSSIFL